MIWIGEYYAKIDDKGRLVLPSPIKSLVPENQKFVIKKDIYEDCLEMFTIEEWMVRSDMLKNSLNFLDKEHAEFWREYTRDRDVVCPDPKFGRISISKKLIEMIGVTKEVVFCGSDYKIEIWAKEKFEKSGLSKEKFISIAQKISSK